MIDLHMHTTFSDGCMTPEELVSTVIANGLKAVAITDHDNTLSYLHAVEAAKETNLEIIPAIEINTWWQEHEVHILGYYIDLNNEYIQDICKEHHSAREEQMNRLVSSIQKHGKFSLKPEDVLSFSRPGGTIGRPHVAKAIVEKGGAATLSDAFKKYLVPTSPTYHRRQTVTPHEAVEAIYESGGISVIAHPGDMSIIEELATDLMNYGLCGIEAYHKSHSAVEISFHCGLSEKLGLIVTGGTDFHGTPEIYPQVLNRLYLPDRVYEELKQEKQRINNKSIKVS